VSDLNRNAELAVIHIAKKELALDDDLYREIVYRTSTRFRRDGICSAGAMTARERAALLEEFHLLGFRNPAGPPRKAPAPGSFQEKKIRELWRLLNEAGALNDSSEKALHAFIKRQTMGAQLMPQWLTAEQANKVIEGLKAWHSRTRREAAPLSRGTSVASPEAD
jgi:phage gp16-like protein